MPRPLCDDFVIGFEHQDDAERVRGAARPADGALWADPPSGQDPPAALPAPAHRTGRRQRSGHLRLPRVHAVLAADSPGSMADGMQDTACAPATGHSGRLRLVSRPSAPADGGAARRAQHVACRATTTTSGSMGTPASLYRCSWHARRAWYKWLNRRSQRTRLTWERFQDLLRDYPLPRPRVMVQIWGT